MDASGFYDLSMAAAVPAEVVGWQQYRARVEGGFMRFFRSPDGLRWVVTAARTSSSPLATCQSRDREAASNYLANALAEVGAFA